MVMIPMDEVKKTNETLMQPKTPDGDSRFG
jgi:hypothetical protein